MTDPAPPGPSTLVVSFVGYETARRSLDAGGAADVVVALRPDPAALAAVVVTGEKVPRGFAETLSSVAVVDGRGLAAAGVDDLDDAFRLVPNVRDADFVDSGIVIRGINSEGVAGPAGSPLATVYVDGLAQTRDGARRGALGTWDVSQIEVYRGPQSTVSGRNALAGKVEVRSNAPVFALAAAGLVEGGTRALNRQALVVNVPVVVDRLALRVSADRRAADGEVAYPLYVGEGGADDDAAFPALEERERDEYGLVRAKLLYQAPAGVRALLTASAAYDSPAYADVDGPSALDPDGQGIAYDDRVWGLQSLPVFVEARSTQADQAGLEVAVPVGDRVTVFSTTGAVRTVTQRPSVDGATSGEIDERELSQEVRAVYVGDRVEAVAGVYVLDGDVDDDRDQFRFFETFRREDRRAGSFTNAAAFGEARVRVAGGLTAIAGLRYDREDQSFALSARRVDVESGAEVSATQSETEAAFDAVLPKAGLSYAFGPGATVGATVQRAFRAGGSAINRVTGEAYDYAPEYAWNYEVSARGRLAGGRLGYGLNAFRLDWRDQQLNVPQVPGDFTSDVILNVGRSTVRGVEAEVEALPAPGLRASASLGVAATEFREFAFLQFGEEVDLSGEPFPQAPAVSAVVGALYESPVGLFVGGDAGYTGEAVSRSFLEGLARDDLPAYTLVNLRAGYRGERFTLTAYAENVLDEDFFRYRFDGDGFQVATLGAGRQLGVSLRAGL